MTQSTTKKKTAGKSAATAARPRRKKPVEITDPFAPARPRSRSRAQSGTRKRASGVKENPLMSTGAARRGAPARATAQRRSPSRPRRVHEPDAYDLLVARAEHAERARRRGNGGGSAASNRGGKAAKNASGGGRKPPRGQKVSFLTFVLSALLVICVMAIGVQLYNYSRFRTMRDAVSEKNFFAGTSIDGVDVSGMTLEAAVAHWEQHIEPNYSGRTVTLDNGTTVTSAELGYSSDYRQVLEEAWRSQTSGKLKDRYEALQRYSASGAGYQVTRRAYSDSALEEYAANLAAQTDTAVQEPSITGFDHSSMTFTFGQGVQGRTLDQAALIADIKSALDAGGGSVTLRIHTQEPAVSVEEMQSIYGLRAYAVTNASSSSANRLTNIALSLEAINGLLLQPGEEFSFNEVVGQRTAERGYRVATAYSAGEVTEELGGGICQVSTTLFNAAVKADLEITERHAHSMPVSYVDKGKDATVSWGAQDLRFVNNTDEPVYIVAILDGDKRVRIGIFGRALPNGEYITVEAEVTETEEFETIYQYNAFLLPGDVSELQAGRNTYKAVAYKLRWSQSGELISREVLCYSTYRGRDAIIEYGP